MPIYRILRNIPEVFEVEADSYDDAVCKINEGELEESECHEDRFELLEELCKHEYSLNRTCGAHVCGKCRDHRGLARCFCGWAADGGNGYRQLEDMGEQIEEEY